MFATLPYRARAGAGIALRSLGKPAASFPGRVATDADLMIAVDRQQTRLAIPLDASATSMTVENAAGIVAYNLLTIDNEIVKTLGAPSGNVVPIARGFDGTTPALHLASAIVSGFVDAWHHNALAAEVEAIEQALGPNLSRIPATPYLISTTFIFPPQTPGGTLSPGNQSITLAPVPQGVNGSNANHYLYISGGTGTAEAVLITGGTAVAGAASGTVIVTCANSHSGAWTIQTATAGIQEAIHSGGSQFSVYIPAGTWDLWGNLYLPATANAQILGAGPGTTVLYAHQSAGNSVYLDGNPASVLDFGNLTIQHFGVGTSDVGLYVNNWSPNANIHDLAVLYAYNGVVMNAQPTMTNVVIGNFQNIGVQGLGSRFGGTWNNVLVGNNIGSGAGSNAPYAVKASTLIDGWYCVNCTFGGADVAVSIDPGTGTASNILISNTIFERYNHAGFALRQGPTGGGSGLIKIDNCRFISRNTAADSTGIILTSDGGAILVDGVTISNCFIGLNIYGIVLNGAANVTITGNTIFGTDLTGLPTPQEGIHISTGASGTINKDIAITGNTIGYGSFGGIARTNQDWKGGPLEIAIDITGAVHQQIAITGNLLFGLSSPMRLDLIPTGLVMANNNGIDNVGTTSIASAASINFQSGGTFSAYPYFTLTGSAAVTAVSGLWEGANGMFIATNPTPGQWTAGATIGSTFTPTPNLPVYWQFRQGHIWLK